MERSAYSRVATAVSLDQWFRYVKCKGSSWNGQITVRVVHGTVRLR